MATLGQADSPVMGVSSIPAASRGGPRPPPSDEHPLVPRSWDTEWWTERGRRADDCPTMHRSSPTEPQSSGAPSDSSPRFGRARNLCGRGSRPPARQDQLSGPGWRRPLRAARGLDRYELPCPGLPWPQHASEAGFSRLAWHHACQVCHQPPGIHVGRSPASSTREARASFSLCQHGTNRGGNTFEKNGSCAEILKSVPWPFSTGHKQRQPRSQPFLRLLYDHPLGGAFRPADAR